MNRNRLTLAVVVAATLAASTSRADLVATFDSRINALYTGELCQIYTYDDATYDVFGTPVNFHTTVGSFYCDNLDDSFLLESTIRCSSSNAGQLHSDFVLPPSAPYVPVPGEPIPFSVTRRQDPELWDGDIIEAIGPDVTYVIEGAHTIDPVGLPEADVPGCPIEGYVGLFTLYQGTHGTINAFKGEATSSGAGVSVSTNPVFFDSQTQVLRETVVDVTFEIISSPGTTTVTATTSTAVPTNPFFALDIGGYTPIYLDVTSTAVHAEAITVCQHYDDGDDDGVVDGTTVPEGLLKMLHGELTGSPPVVTWIDKTVSQDPDANIVCGRTYSLSPFVLGVDLDVDDDDWLDAVDPCIDPGGSRNLNIKPKLLIKNTGNDSTPNDERLLLKGEYIAPAGGFAALSPDIDGVHIVLVDDNLTPIADVVIPGGAGWSSASGKKFAFKDSTGANNGIVKLQIKDRSKKAPDQIQIKVVGKNGSYPVDMTDPIGTPLRATVVTGDGDLGECAEMPPSACKINGSKTALTCKR